MTNTSDDKAIQKRHKREKATIDHLVDRVHERKPAEGHIQNPTTNSGLPVEEQVRKEWDEERWSPDFLTGNHNLAREAAQAFAASCTDARAPE